MAAHYDTFDYPAYWIGREYEHEAEIVALKALLEKIPKIDTILEIGAGFGRLTPFYLFRARKIILSDPSSKLLAIARRTFAERKNIKFIQSCAENLPHKIPKESIDVIILVRVLHHLKDPDNFFDVCSRLLKKNGYLILEFANKKHLKATFKEFFKGNFTFPLDIFPQHIGRCRLRSKKKNTIPFFNFHPEIIKDKLRQRKFEIKEGRSVSNIRSDFFKKLFTQETLITIEKILQRPFNLISFGPSIFLLAQKRQ